MNRKTVRSSNLKSVGYDFYKKILEIEFKSGSTYQYFNVPSRIYNELLRAPSAGRYFNQNIAHAFNYQLLGNTSYKRHFTVAKVPEIAIDIKNVYKKLALRFHPDMPSGDEVLMKTINQFYKEQNYYGLLDIANQYAVL